ncbi:response regulator transcription factor [Brachybacterium sp. p3-SID1565]|uniref:response regulator transcription factor n=1 Tax=Brachybacterium sp. p3-SID1565 TaxID=2916046 RepID=UPI0021A8771F|nr:response regulator transcription factor [Brachybacterium sp. p3-SID1565]MCT1385755.1 response regulator transcription factor [Brachybacterium sp. p3-SID1565]
MAHILVVDDDPDIRELVSLKLRSSGHEVTPVASGEAARDTLLDGSTAPVDLAVVDHMMPGMTGVDLLRLWRSEGSTLRVLMLTARSQERDLEAGFAAGADDYLTKPFSPRELAARVTALLARR